jgi:3'(2'), 5'-bisphosphate nucleotidase
MQCIIEEAGGMIRNMDDTEIVYNREDSTNAKGFYILNKLENKWKIV